MSRRTDAPPPTADRDLDRVAATLRARFDREAVASASRPEPVPNLSPSDGSLSLGVLPPTTSLPPVAAREVPLIRPGAAASARADPLAARALAAAVAAVSRYAREETARLAAFARTLELEIRNADTVDTVALEARRAALDACARRATLAGDILEHAIDVIDASFESFESFDRSIAHDAHDLANLPSLRASFEPVVLAASAAYAAARARTDPGAGEPLAMGKTWRPPDAFERKTAKYWVEPRHVLALKLELAKHLPVLVFETASQEKSRDFENTKKKNKNTTPRDGGAVTSVYLDSKRGDVYESRLTREQGATLVRVRWYGDDDVDDDDVRNTSPVFVERKTHHESWSRDGSTKERFALRRNDARAFVVSRSPPVANANVGSARTAPPSFLFDKGDEGTRIARTRLANEITRFELEQKNITPSVRTEYRRVAFQRSDDNAVRVSLDVDLTFADARGIDDWDGPSRRSAKVKHAFPFAVLEIKTRDETPPEWVERALRSAPCVEVRKFSKFLHATMLTRRAESQTGAARAPHWWSDESDAGVDPLAVRRQIMTDPNVACCALERDDVVVTVGPSSSGPGPRPGLPADVRKKKGAEPSAGTNREKKTDLESGLMDPARDDASEGGSGSGSGSSVSGVTRDERVFLSRFLLGGGVGAREGTRPKAPRAPRSLFLSRAFRFARGGNDAGENRNRATHAGKTRNSSFADGTSTVVPRYVPVKVEPKTFFANERTLLQWLSMSVLLLFAALALLNNAPRSLGTAATAETSFSRTTPASFAPNDAIRETRNAGASGASGVSSGVVSHNASFLGGAALAPVSIAFMAYALWTYLWRARRIARREPSARYDDIAGPTALVVVLVIVSSVAAAVAVADAARRFA